MGKHDNMLALGALGLAAWYLTRDEAKGKPRPGTFRPEDARKMPDFEYVTQGVSEAEGDDWMAWIWPPGYAPTGDLVWRDEARAQQDAVYAEQYKFVNQGIANGYFGALWLPASRISLDTLTVGDMERAAYFLGGGWMRGPGVGCALTRADKLFRGVNDQLESVASGLDIGSAIGIGLASIFGYGKGAEASDKAFGFGRGAAEERAAKVDLTRLPDATQAQLATLSAYAKVAEDPAGTAQGSNAVLVNGRAVGVIANLFGCSYTKWSEGWAAISESTFKLDFAGRDVPYFCREGGTLVPRRQRDGSPGTPGSLISERHDGNWYLRRAFALPWHSLEMGCNLSTRERAYIAARMYRVIDLVRTIAKPEDSRVIATGYELVQPFVPSPDDPTMLIPNVDAARAAVGQYVSFGYTHDRFGVLRGTIFPATPGEAVLSELTASTFAKSRIPTGSSDVPSVFETEHASFVAGSGAMDAPPVDPVAPLPAVGIAGAPSPAGTSFLGRTAFTRK